MATKPESKLVAFVCICALSVFWLALAFSLMAGGGK